MPAIDITAQDEALLRALHAACPPGSLVFMSLTPEQSTAARVFQISSGGDQVPELVALNEEGMISVLCADWSLMADLRQAFLEDESIVVGEISDSREQR